MRFRSYYHYIRHHFGERIDRITVNAGFTCPNIDGTKAKGGCTFCQDASYTSLTYYQKQSDDILNQINRSIEYLKNRYPSQKFFVYFQNGTNTYAALDKLEKVFNQALSHHLVKGLIISTRPDCLNDDVVGLLAELNQKTYLEVEMGMPSHLEKHNRKLNRAHTVDDFLVSVKKLAAHNIHTCAHVIHGIPDETFEEMISKADFFNQTPINAIKIHNMVVFKDTTLEKQFLAGHYQPLSMEDYVNACIGFLENLRPDIVVQRLVAHGPKRVTVAPEWSVNKWNAINKINEELEKRNTWQAKKLGFPISELAIFGKQRFVN